MTRVLYSIILAGLFLFSPITARAGDVSLTASQWVSYSYEPPNQVKLRTPLNFDVPVAPKEVGYITTTGKALSSKLKIRLEYKVTGTGQLIAQGENPPARIALYFQRTNDDWTCSTSVKNTQFYRWWSVVRLEVKPGSYVHEVSLSDLGAWGSCLGIKANGSSAATTYFNNAKANVARMGFTFGGSSSAGHGISVRSGTGSINIQITRFTLVDPL